MGVRLPSEYQEVEYLQSAGAQYINTRINVRSGLKTIAKVELTSVDRVQYICGGYTASPRVYFSPFYCRSNNTVGCAYNTTEFPSNYTVTAKTPYFIESILSNGTQSLKINGELAISGQVERAFEANWPIWIFANNNSNKSYRRFAFAKISLFELIDSDSNEVIRKFIPCYRKSDSKPGMYDLVSGTFYTNAGTGEFTVGPDVIDSISPWLVARRRGLMHNVSRYIYEASNLSFNGKSDCINTGVYLFTQENIDRDFEFIAEGIVGNGNVRAGDSTIICAKYDTGALGFLVRPTGGTALNYKGTIYVKWNENSTVIVRRINGVITLSGTNITNPTIQFTNAVFNHPLVFGCALQNDGTPYRYCQGTIAHVTVRWL